MHRCLLAYCKNKWHLLDMVSGKELRVFDTKLEALHYTILKFKRCPEGGTLTIEKKNGDVQEERVFLVNERE